jgi:hypothetical protein
MPIVCLCQLYSVCGCDDNKDDAYFSSLLNDTNSQNLPRNSEVVRVALVNGTTRIYVNGTLPNGTTAPDPSITEDAAVSGKLLKLSGYWAMAALSVAAVTLL